MCRKVGQIEVKGFSQAVTVYEAMDWRKNLGGNKSFIEQYADGFSLHMDLDELAPKDRAEALNALESAAEHLRHKG
jgi:hypothetical protein